MTFVPYRPNIIFKSSHFNTIYPTVFRKSPSIVWDRKRFETPDGDFFDVDFSAGISDNLVLLLHGLEGNSNSNYIRGMGAVFAEKGWGVGAVNFRGCSGEMNRTAIAYHSGFTNDLAQLVLWAEMRFRSIVIIGFSLGGNVTLKYLGESGSQISSKVVGAVAISVPMDLHSSARSLEKPGTFIYRKRFLSTLKRKAIARMKMVELKLNQTRVRKAKTIKEFDDAYTAPVYGFHDVHDYYTKCSSKQFIPGIEVPTMIMNARDDTFLGKGCYPKKECSQNPFCTLLTPHYGGHVGFAQFQKGHYWSEKTAFQFITSVTREI